MTYYTMLNDQCECLHTTNGPYAKMLVVHQQLCPSLQLPHCPTFNNPTVQLSYCHTRLLSNFPTALQSHFITFLLSNCPIDLLSNCPTANSPTVQLSTIQLTVQVLFLQSVSEIGVSVPAKNSIKHYTTTGTFPLLIFLKAPNKRYFLFLSCNCSIMQSLFTLSSRTNRNRNRSSPLFLFSLDLFPLVT